MYGPFQKQVQKYLIVVINIQLKTHVIIRYFPFYSSRINKMAQTFHNSSFYTALQCVEHIAKKKIYPDLTTNYLSYLMSLIIIPIFIFRHIQQ